MKGAVKKRRKLPLLRCIFKNRQKLQAVVASEAVDQDVVGVDEVRVDEVQVQDSTVAVMIKCGLLHYLKTRNKSEQESKTIANRWSHFINWTYLEENGKHITPTEENITEWARILIGEKYDMLLQYSSYLQEQRQLKPTTVRNYIGDIEACCAWVTMFASSAIRQAVSSFEGIKRVAHLVRTSQGQRNKRARSHITMEQKINLYQLPPGGLPDLQRAVAAELPWARAVRSELIDEVAYGHFMQLMFAAMYVLSPNGRQSGVADIKYRQVNELLTQYFTTSTQFKTCSKFGYQPVTLQRISHELVHRYVTVLRPQVRRPSAVEDSEEPLWLTYKGEREDDVGRLVTRFFTRTCNLSVTITAIRSLVETTMDKKYKEGKITDTQRTAVQNINGHSSATTKAYYLLENRTDDVLCSRGALVDELDAFMDELAADLSDDELGIQRPLPLPLPLSPPPFSQLPTTPTTASTTAPVSERSRTVPSIYMEWGTEHPDYKVDGKGTAVWTDKEKIFLWEWCTNYRATYPEVKTVVAKCLNHIRTNPIAVRIFHRNHILNSSRLRNGLRQFEKEREADQRTRTLRTSAPGADGVGENWVGENW